jgi:DNA transformation protein
MAGMNEFLDELFEPVGGVSIRRMFSSLGVFKRDLMFGLLIRDVLHLKADEQSAPRYLAEGSQRWIYKRKNQKGIATSYWTVPERLLDDRDEFKEWADEAFKAALRIEAAKKKPGGRKKAAAKAKPKPKTKAKAKPVSRQKPPPKKKAAPKRR